MNSVKDKNKNDIKEAVVEAIAFFDLFNLPLNAFDILGSLRIKASLSDVLEVLEDLSGTLLSKEGPFYFLSDKNDMSEASRKYFHLAREKAKIARRAAGILKNINGIEAVILCNNFYYKDDSDVDLLIIIKSGRIWLSRLLTTLVLHLFRLRRHGKKVANRICLSFYITRDCFDLEQITLPGEDPYFYQWFRYLTPVYDNGVFDVFWTNNCWLKNKLPNNFKTSPIRSLMVEDSFLSKKFKKLNGYWFDSRVGNVIEKLVKNLQLKKMSYNEQSLAGKPDSRVIISDSMLKFHENDRRQEFLERLRAKKDGLVV